MKYFKIILLLAMGLMAVSANAQLGLLTKEKREALESVENQGMRTASTLLTYDEDSSAQTILILPDSAIIWDVDVRIITAFNDSGADSIEIGHTGDPNYYVADMSARTGSGAFSSMSYANDPPKLIFEDDTITAMYWGENSDATAGAAAVYVTYTKK